jgi:flavin-dependent dehydrogenase
VVVLERERFPRFHIGESQLPWINEVLVEIGADQMVARAGFVEKWGASFVPPDGSKEFYADFTQAWEVPSPRTYQVPRARFDQLLLEHAASCGARVLQGRRAERATFDVDGVTLAHTGDDGDAAELRVGAVIDASGRAGFLAKQFGQRRQDEVLQNISVHRQFEGIPRAGGRRAGDIRMVTRSDRGWIWFIPISETVTSVGVVVPRSVHSAYNATGRHSAEETLDHFLAGAPAAARLVALARPVSPARYDADYSYLHDHHAGDRYLLVGDAGAFLDPIFSTGVLLAMQSGLEAAGVLSEGLRRGDMSRARFTAYERKLVRRYRHFRRFAVGFYDAPFRDLFLNPQARFGLYQAVLSILGGNWRPSLKTRLRIALFFALVGIQRRFPVLVPPLPVEQPPPPQPGMGQPTPGRS